MPTTYATNMRDGNGKPVRVTVPDSDRSGDPSESQLEALAIARGELRAAVDAVVADAEETRLGVVLDLNLFARLRLALRQLEVAEEGGSAAPTR
jgi:hypothetical protein